MEFIAPTPPLEWIEAKWGIREPKEGRVIRDIREFQFIFVPALGFHKEGYRLGRGKGFYDRALQTKTKNPPIGIAYSCNLNLEFTPNEYDFRFSRVITEKGLLDF